MAKTYPNKWFNESMQAAPQTVDFTAGAMVAILKACLVDGFGALSPDSIVWDSELELAKASFSSGHSYLVDSVIDCSGSAVSDYNGEHRVMQVTTNDMWFELDTVPVAAASGALEIKIAPLGWELSFQDENQQIMIFTPAGNLGNVSLRVNNSEYTGWIGGTYNATLMKVAMVENVIDIDTYDVIYEHSWPAGSYGSDRKWDLIGDNRIIFFLPEYGAGKEQAGFYAGYIDSVRAADNYHFIMNRLDSESLTSNNNRWSGTGSYYYYTHFIANEVSTHNIMARAYHQLEGVTAWEKLGFGSYNSDSMALPNPVDNGFYIAANRAPVLETGNYLRGYMPIMVFPLGHYSAYNRKNLKNLPEHDGKIFRLLVSTYNVSASDDGRLVGFDISTVEV